MLPYYFDATSLREQVQGLPRRHGAAFAALCCERLLPNYRRFVDEEHWGDFTLLRSALDQVWAFVGGQAAATENFRLLAEQCDRVIPNAEDFATLLCSQALDAGAAIYETLHYCLDGTPGHLVNVATSCRDTVDMYIQERDNMDYHAPDFEETILSDPLMIRELRRQLEDLALVRQCPPLDPEFVGNLRVNAQGKSNILEST